MPSSKIYQWFDLADQLVSVMLRKTNGTRFANEASEIAREYHEISEIFFDRIREDGKFEDFDVAKYKDLTEAKNLFDRMMDVQRRMIEMSDKVERPN